MNKRATALAELLERLADGQIVPVETEDWEAWRQDLTVAKTVPSAIGGDKHAVRWPVPGSRRRGWALVEEAEPGLMAVRPLRDRKQVLALIAERLAAYERMWDG